MKKFVYVICLFLVKNFAIAQYSPLPGFRGSIAIHADSSVFVSWATKAEIERGYINIADTGQTDNGSNRASFGFAENALGKADGQVVSLGDSGIATVYFDIPVCDGPGWDFAIFENGFILENDTTLAFLELASVAVSSDGEHFFSFSNHSLTQTTTQIDAFEALDTRKIDNLAGKFPLMWGTPFDLSQLPDNELLDKNHICCIKITDVIGSIETNHFTTDSQGNKINDPFPTPFASSGFDLDAVGVINNMLNTNNDLTDRPKIYPNPFDNEINIIFTEKILHVNIYETTGKSVVSCNKTGKKITVGTEFLNSGLYFCIIETEKGKFIQKIIKQ